MQIKNIAIQMDAIQTIDLTFDSTFLLAHEAQQRGYNIFYYNPEDLESIILVNLPNKDEVCILSSSFSVFPDGKMDIFGEPLPYDFPVSGSDVDLDRYGISDLGELDFKPEEYEGREFVEKLFNFYLKFS